MKIFLKAVYAGLMISIGGAVYLSCDVKYVGALLFCVGLFAICEFGFKLYTGMVGYITANPPKYIKDVLLALAGNIAGCLVSGYALSFVRPDLLNKAAELCAKKAGEGIFENLLMSLFCGMLMYIAVDLFRSRNNAAKHLGIFLAVPTFILSGFEHCIANAFYLAAGHAGINMWLTFMPICILGNALGAVIISLAKKIKD